MRFNITLAVLQLGLMSVMCACGACESLKNSTEYDSFGGTTAIKADAAGFFHLTKIDERHFLVTPEGNGYRALGINHFHNMTSKDRDGAIRNIKAWGFNAGCYQGPQWMWHKYPYTKGINLLPICQWMPNQRFGFKDVFDPGYLAQLEKDIRKIVEPQRDNTMLIGYFWTDIPLWQRNRNGQDWISFYKTLPKHSGGGKVWANWKAANPNTNANVFLAVIAKQLYSKAYAFIRKYDQNHLIFGDRYHEIDMPDRVVKEALPYIDAIAIQPTSREFNFRFFDTLYVKYGKPIYIADHVSSFATEAHPVTMGQATQNIESYVTYYERYLTAALTRPYMIGYNKCQYQDEPAKGMLKQGLLQRNEEPYSTIPGITAANIKVLDYAYSGKEPEGIGLDPMALRITTPKDGDDFAVGSNIEISATANLEKIGGGHVCFYYLDGKWKLIGRDSAAPFTATWENPPVGDWDIYVAVHDTDWKIVDKARIRITVGDSS